MRKFALPLLVIAALVGYVGHWFYLSRQVPGAVADWAAVARDQGYDVRYGAVSVGGFPLKLDAVVADVAIAGSFGDMDWTWSAPEVGVLLRPWRFDRLLLSLPGAHELILIQQGRSHRVTMTQQNNQIALVTEDGRLAVLGFDAKALRLADEEGVAIAAGELKLRIERRDDGDAVTVGLQLEKVDLPSAPPRFPAQVTSMTWVASLVGRVPPGPVRAAVASWRDTGGTMETERLHLVWGTFDLEGEGTLALDSAFRPIGAYRLRVAGYAQAIESAVARGVLDPVAARAVRAALDLVAKPAEDGGPPRAEVALSLQDGTVYVGPIAVGRVEPLPLPD